MNSVHLIGRIHIRRDFFKVNKLIQNTIYWSSSSSSSRSSKSSSSSSSSSSEDEEKSKKLKSESQKNNEEALTKLNNLLKTMIEEDTIASKSKLELAKPLNKRKKNLKEEGNSEKVQPQEKKIVTAVKNIAEVIGGDTKQTESELLMKLLSTSESKSANNLIDIVKGMKVDHKAQKSSEQSRAQQVKQILEGVQKTKSSDRQRPKPMLTKTRSDIPLEKINLFGSEPLGIFTDLPSDATEGVQNKTWSKLHERDLKLAVTHPPSNYFQQMILWTEQGKVWKFPIDNEQGLEEEKNVYFTEHVFLEQHLEPWCPARGPLRHFMELVCVGLSKNPYLTVEAKKEHIDWFKNYFEDKKQLLKEVGALQDIELSKASKPKQIE